MSEQEWYDKLFSKVQEKKSELADSSQRLDLMEVTFKDGDTVLQKWVTNLLQ